MMIFSNNCFFLVFEPQQKHKLAKHALTNFNYQLVNIRNL